MVHISTSMIIRDIYQRISEMIDSSEEVSTNTIEMFWRIDGKIKVCGNEQAECTETSK
jgi:hypothetical protein